MARSNSWLEEILVQKMLCDKKQDETKKIAWKNWGEDWGHDQKKDEDVKCSWEKTLKWGTSEMKFNDLESQKKSVI